MKVSVCSDLHLEFGAISLENTDNADVLILSGDICVAKDVRAKDDYGLMGENNNNKIHTFFQECCERFPHVIYIMGNHEHYHGDFAKSLANLREHLGYLWNLHILDKECVTLNGVNFVGGTLWTDMNKEDPVTLQHIRGYMNDYRIIDNSNEMVNYKTFLPDPENPGKEVTVFKQRPGKFSPEDSVKDHRTMMEFVKERLEKLPQEKWVVVGHHSPSKQSVKPRYRGDFYVNGAYSSDLSEFILDHPQIKLWTHGHTHEVFDYMIGSTRILCNPRGYIGHEDCADSFKLVTVEV